MSKNYNYVPIGSIALHNFNSSMGYFNRNIYQNINKIYFRIVLINNLTYIDLFIILIHVILPRNRND